MYYSPVPLLIIRADAPALIEVNGHPAGECGADSHIALPLSDSGDYYVALLPLFDREDARLYPVTRKISFENGSIRSRPAPAPLRFCLPYSIPHRPYRAAFGRAHVPAYAVLRNRPEAFH